jgi:methylphosphotriester-DNA--protein-cysteine methyltransferase
MNSAPDSWADLVAENKKLRRRIKKLENELQKDYRGPYVSTSNRRIFHRPDCRWVREIDTDKLEYFKTHEEAASTGYKPCKTCRA